jgi:PKD repeat protein
VEYRNGEQHPLSSPPDFSAIEQHELQKLLPAQTNTTLALANIEQQISAFIPTEDNPTKPLLPSTNQFSSDTSNTTVSFLQLQLDRNNSWNFDTSISQDFPPANFLTDAQTTNSLTLEQLSRIESTAVNFWQSLLPSHQPLEVNFQIGDLADGQIAEAQVTKFSSTGVPVGGTIIIDRDAQGAGWFVDATPLDWSEFTTWTGGSLQAKPDSAAANKYDLFTTILHELGHIAGFGHGYATVAGQNVSLSTDKNHITGETYSHDLMAAGLELGERRLPSALDIALIADSFTSEPQAYSAPLSVTGITNGDFSIANSQDPNFKWQTYGATIIMDGIATLSDTSKQLANLTQKFLIPPNATKLQFTVKNSQLGIRKPGSTPAPNDSFEVALLDAQMNPLAGKVRGLSDTDSLLNLQADGTVYFSDKVQIGGVSTSGSKLTNANDRTISIDLTGIAGNTEAILYFDLLSFSSGVSKVSIDNVKVFTSDRPAPQLQNANLIINQATGVNIPASPGATISNIELATAPQQGTVSKNAAGQVIYTPNNDYVGNDSFTYLGFSPDGQISNLATVNITVNNVAPTIEQILIPNTSKEGQTIQLAATAKDGGSPNNLTYTWNFGDNSNPVIGQNATHTYTDNGTYNIVLTVTDKDGGSTQQTTQITVENVAPVVGITAPVNAINQGGTLNFGVNYSDAGTQDTHTITWNFDDGSSPVIGNTNPSHIFTKAGTNNVTVTVTDNDGASTTKQVQIAVANIAPTINTVNIPININEGQPVQLTATASDPGNDALIYRWYINGATTPIIGQAINYTFLDNGIYPVKLEVIDSDGAVTTQTVDVTVNNVAPTIANITKPNQINEGQAVEFKATATDAGINDTLTYSWNFGDNTTAVAGQNAIHTFADNGNYNVVLTVTDKDGGVTTQTTAVKVDNVTPVIVSITKPTQLSEGQAFEFKATATDAGVNDTLTYSWNFGDNTTAVAGQNAIHTFADNGNYNVILTVTDKDGGVTTQTTAVKVDNVAPVIVSVTKPTQLNEGQAFEFKAMATDVGIKDTLTYLWNFGDATPNSTGQNAIHTFADNGNYNVVLTVTDKDGAVTTQTTAVKVDNVAPIIVSIVKPTAINQGQAASFSATATDVGVKDTLTYAWNFGDNTPTSAGQNTTHTFTAAGNYPITLAVTDKDGATSITTQQITVASLPNITLNDPTITEGNSGSSNITFTITLNQASTQTVSVAYNTSNITALAGSDYTASSGTITFAAGEISKTITIAILGDTIAESTETFALNLSNAVNATITKNQGTATILDDDTVAITSGIRSGGTVTISGSANLDGNINSRTDDTRIYAAKGVNLNGSIGIPVKRDAAGNPLKDASGKIILETNEITVGLGGSTSNLSSKYANIGSATQTIAVPTYADTKQQDFLSKIPATGVITYDIGLNPIGNTATWNSKFPPAGTSTNPTVVKIVNGSLNLPANINLSNYIIIVENGNINFSQGNPVMNNVTLIANAGTINLKSVKGTSLSLCASGDINFSGSNQLTGNNIINSTGNAHFEGDISMTNTASQVKIVAQGNIEISGNTSLKGQLWTKKDFAASGSTTIVGAITAIDNVNISGNSTITGG